MAKSRFFLLWLVTAGIAVIFTAGCGDNVSLSTQQVATTTNAGEDNVKPDGKEEIKNFRLSHTRRGEIVWTLVARKARFESGDEVLLEDPVLEFPHNNNDTSHKSGQTVIKASNGKVDMKTSRVITYGKTTLESPDKKIMTSDISYEPSEDRISTDKNVFIVTDESEITGTSMVSDSRLEKITISDQVVRMKSQKE